jgi:hypothetical protein
MVIEDDNIDDRCSTCSTVCSCSMNRHGFFLVSIYIGRMKISNRIAITNEFNIINIDLTKQWQWSSFFPLSQSTVQFNLFDSFRFNTVSFIYFHSIDSIRYITIRFDMIWNLIIFFLIYSPWTFYLIFTPLHFIHVPPPSYSVDLFDLIRYNTSKFFLFSFDSFDSIHYNSIQYDLKFKLIYSFYYTHHGLFIFVTPPSYSEDLFDLIRFNIVSFICFPFIRYIRFDMICFFI